MNKYQWWGIIVLMQIMIGVLLWQTILLGRISVDSERETARKVTEIYHQQYDVIAHGPVNLLDNASSLTE